LIRSVTAGLGPVAPDVVHTMAVAVTAVTEQAAVPIVTDTWPGLLPKLPEVPTMVNVAEGVPASNGTLQMVLTAV
jgi:hypothetical protein